MRWRRRWWRRSGWWWWWQWRRVTCSGATFDRTRSTNHGVPTDTADTLSSDVNESSDEYVSSGGPRLPRRPCTSGWTPVSSATHAGSESDGVVVRSVQFIPLPTRFAATSPSTHPLSPACFVSASRRSPDNTTTTTRPAAADASESGVDGSSSREATSPSRRRDFQSEVRYLRRRGGGPKNCAGIAQELRRIAQELRRNCAGIARRTRTSGRGSPSSGALRRARPGRRGCSSTRRRRCSWAGREGGREGVRGKGEVGGERCGVAARRAVCSEG